MSKDLAESIALAAQKLERNEREVISIIYRDRSTGLYKIIAPTSREFESFEQAFNFLSRKGYKADASDKKNLANRLNEIDSRVIVGRCGETFCEPKAYPVEAAVLTMFQKIDVWISTDKE